MQLSKTAALGYGGCTNHLARKTSTWLRLAPFSESYEPGRANPLNSLQTTQLGTTNTDLTTHFDRSLMLCECVDGCVGGQVLTAPWWPDVEQVVVATTGQKATVGRPAQTADLLCVTAQCPHLVVGHAYVVVVDVTAAWPTAITHRSCLLMQFNFLFIKFSKHFT